MNKKLFILALLTVFFSPNLVAAQADIDPTGATGCVQLTSSNLRYKARDVQTNGEVSILQDFLQSEGYLNVAPSGYFGLLTLKAVKAYQRASTLSPTGYVGTFTKLTIARQTGCLGNGAANQKINSGKTILNYDSISNAEYEIYVDTGYSGSEIVTALKKFKFVNGKASFTGFQNAMYADITPRGTSFGDLDGDGDVDAFVHIMLSHGNSPASAMYIALNDSGSIKTFRAPLTSLDSSTTYFGVADSSISPTGIITLTYHPNKFSESTKTIKAKLVGNTLVGQ